ncbi:MAG: hypothetical protein ACRDGW_04735, partial [Actinomycetota bacterium]
PSSRLVPTSLNKGRPIVLDEPNSDVSSSIRGLAERFIVTPRDHSENGHVEQAATKRRGLFRRN